MTNEAGSMAATKKSKMTSPFKYFGLAALKRFIIPVEARTIITGYKKRKCRHPLYRLGFLTQTTSKGNNKTKRRKII